MSSSPQLEPGWPVASLSTHESLAVFFLSIKH
jgi:hypothetical protein